MTKVKMSNVLARPKPPDTLPPPPEPKSQPRPQLPPQTHPPPPPLTPDRPTQVLVCSQLHQDIQMWIKTSKCGLRHNRCTVANVFRLLQELTIGAMNTTRSMQGMFGASVSELYLLIKLLINIERTVDLCVITKKEIHMHTQEL